MNVNNFWPRRWTAEEMRARQRELDSRAHLLVVDALTDDGEHRTTVDELRKALAFVPDEAWVVLYDPRLDRRLWVQSARYNGHFELTGVRR